MSFAGFVHVFNRNLPGALAEVPEENLDLYAEGGWERVPDDLNLRDKGAVDAFLAEAAAPPEESKPARKTKET